MNLGDVVCGRCAGLIVMTLVRIARGAETPAAPGVGTQCLKPPWFSIDSSRLDFRVKYWALEEEN